MPETSHATVRTYNQRRWNHTDPQILHRKAQRMQKADPSRIYTAPSAHTGTITDLFLEAAWGPAKMFFEPTLLVYNSYLALIYGLFYLWFESFPLIFVEVSWRDKYQGEY
jgi:DHA1 family multidrug resistance protein-like MFS transporter